MKLKLYLVLGFLLAGFLQISCLAAEPPVRLEDLEIDQEHTWDFGQVKEGEVLKHSFILKNDTKRFLRIFNVYTSCGCTASKVEKKILAPGTETPIEVEFDTKGYSGEISQFVFVKTNKILHSTVTFKIKAEVIKK